MEVRNVSFSYGEKPIIENLSLSLSGGRHIAVMGESGRGKTTLLRLLAGFIQPTSGSIERSEKERPALVFQEDRLLPWYSAYKNVSIPACPGCDPEAILKDMELSESLHKLPKELSGGMQRRVAIARALAFRGDPLLLDEPFKGLDADMRARIAKQILKYAEGTSILLITHDEHEAELLECSELIRL